MILFIRKTLHVPLMINRFSTYLQQQLQAELPGKKAHIEVAPYRNVNFDKKEIAAAIKSGVLILFYFKENEIYTVLMQRTVYKGSHSGQISFPGGKAEKSDTDIYHTALREANEEIGIISSQVDIIGKLSEVFIPVSNFHVVPVVGIMSAAPQFIIEEREVETIIEININHLIKHPLKQNKVKLSNNTLITVPAFEFQDKVIWGATALMLNELKHILKDWKS